MQPDPAARPRPGLLLWAGFLAAPFAALALIGLFATYAVGLPHDRWAAREQAMAEAAALLAAGASAERFAPLRPALGEAARALDAPAPLAALAAAREESRAFFLRQSEAVRARMRLLLGVGALAAFGFGVIVLGLSRANDRPG